MRTVHVVPSITEEASGPSYSVLRLCESLIEVGDEVTLAALDLSPMRAIPRFMKVFPLGRGPKRLGRSPEMLKWLLKETASSRLDFLHSHGMWQMSAVYPGWVSRATKTGLIVSPRGAFSRWAMSHGSPHKKIFWPAIQRPALRWAACFHATAESEYRDIRRLGFEQPVAIIPNGIDIPQFDERRGGQASKKNPRTLIFLGRIHPIKGIEHLLNAWCVVMNEFQDWRLMIVGTDEVYGEEGGYLRVVQALAARLGLRRVEFLPPLYGPAKFAAYREAELFVLPTLSENFGIAVAEALASGTPAIVTKGAPWEGLQANSAGWWIDIGEEALINGLRLALAKSSAELAKLGESGRNWMIRDFSWREIAFKMHRTCCWLSEGGTPPAWVKAD